MIKIGKPPAGAEAFTSIQKLVAAENAAELTFVSSVTGESSSLADVGNL
jgi:hypothetical protein